MSSLFGALTTAVSGLTAQSAAFSNISDNVANSTTVGYKATNTNFTDYLTTSTAVTNDFGFVTATPSYTNEVQGTISASTNTTAMAISGNGFFQVTQASTDNTSTEILGTQAEYTRDGNFSLDKNGYLVNDAGMALNGWLASATPVTNATTGVTSYPIDQSVVKPIQISQASLPPVETSNVTLSANLPATPPSTSSSFVSQVNVYDAKGTLHNVSLTYTPVADTTTTPNTVVPDQWNVSVSSPDDQSGASLGTALMTFNSDGTLNSISGSSGSLVGSDNSTSGSAATFNLALNFGDGPQSVNVGVGTLGTAASTNGGLTQYAGTTYTLNNISQNGLAPGAFSSVTTQSNGDVIANYDNGQSRVVAQVPVTNFANADGLQKQNGQAYTVTAQSGAAVTDTTNTGGAGKIVTNSTEGSNVDIATEFTKLIVAQQAYSANTKVVTTANDMLQQTINMKT